MSNTQNAKSELTITLQNRGIDESTWSAILSSVFPSAKEESALMAIDYCKARGLDILKKPCHIVPMNVKNAVTGNYEWRDVIMPGIAEQRITASRTGEYVGQDAAVFGDTIEINIGGDTHQAPEWCTITVYRLISGERVGFSHIEYFEEACGTMKGGKLNSMWTKRKRGQLAKCAEAGALRKAFPEELGGMNTADEMEGQHNAKPDERNVTTKASFKALPDFDGTKERVSEPTETQSPVDAEIVETQPERKPEEETPQPVEPQKYTLTISNYDSESGTQKKSGRPYTLHAVTLTDGKNELVAKTYSNTIGGIAEYNVGEQGVVTLSKTKKGGWQLDTLELVNAAVEGGIC